MPHVLVTAPFSDALLDKLTAVSPQYKIEQMTLADGRWPEGQTTEAEIYYAVTGIPSPEQAPNLRWVQVHWAGVDRLRDHPIWTSTVFLTTASGIHTPNMAQYVLAQLSGWAHRVPNWYKWRQEQKWPKQRWQQFAPTELRDATLGILGYGSIGREVARLAKALGMKILVTKYNLRRMEDTGYIVPGTGDYAGTLPDRIYPPEATASVVAQCDYIVITLPLTPATHHLIDEALLKQMKPNCFLVNIGRGEIVDENALVKALKKGWIAGAGLDVFAQEPLPEDSPLWQLENAILTPHVSGFTPHYDERAVDLFAANLQRYLLHQPLFNLVNREAGY
ncbi:MAG: D-2-hydroxyacid dehydrogenase [Candidatus Promineifilaceae bacterium]